jgi:hypothetical protein
MNLSTKHDDTLLSLSIQLVTIFEPPFLYSKVLFISAGEVESMHITLLRLNAFC